MVFRTIDLIDVLFNSSEEEKEVRNDLSVALEPLWHGMKWLFIYFFAKQEIPILFLRALQYPYGQGKLIKTILCL
jgi:hypothetical protein